MNKYSRYNDIEAIMQKAEKELISIETKYKNYLKMQTIPASLLVEVKGYLSNLRSALDYLWCKVPNVGSSAHFPITNSQKFF